MRIGYLGPIGTYSYEACKKYIGKQDNVEMQDFKTITETITAVNENKINIAIVPIENMAEGGVCETIDCLLENVDLNIIDEITIPVKHYLLSKAKNVSDIKEIYSHPQGLAQCRKYIIKNFPKAELTEMASTTMAAEHILLNREAACIGNKACSEIYGLEILESNINDKDNNATKFILLSKTKSDIMKNDKTSLVFSTKNEPGELYKVLGLFNIFNINLTKIESRPAKTKFGEYIFWIDFIGTEKQDHIKVLLEQIELKCSYFRILGEY